MNVPSLVGDRARLRPWCVADAEWYVAARDDLIFQWTTESPALTVAEAQAAIAALADDDAVASFAVCDSDDRLVGNVTAVIDDGTAEVSYFLAPEGRGRGLASDAVGLLTGWLVGAMEVDRVVATVAAGNVASTAVLEATGFRVVDTTTHAALGESEIWELRPADQA